MQRSIFKVGALALLVAFLSGCIQTSPQAYLGPTGVPPQAAHQTGDGDTEVQVHVVEAKAPQRPIPDAPIVIHEIPRPEAAPTVQELVLRNTSLGGRTGSDGILYARLDLGATYTFITQLPNSTLEARHLVRIESAHRDRPIVIAVFPLNASTELSGRVPLHVQPNTAAELGGGRMAPLFATRWWPSDIRFDQDNRTNLEILHRLQHLHAQLNYTLPAGSAASLGLVVAVVPAGAEQPSATWEGRWTGLQVPPDGTMTAEIFLDAAKLAHIAKVKDPSLRIGPSASQSVLTTECVSWTIDVEAELGTTPRPQPSSNRPHSLTESFLALPSQGC